MLLVLGMCLFAGGTRFAEQEILATSANLNGSLLTIAIIAILIPAAFHFALRTSTTVTDAVEQRDLLEMSHGVAIVLLLIYLSYLVFQLWSHAHL